MRLSILAVLSTLCLSGCAGGAAMMALNGATMAISAVTEKSVMDHAVSMTMDQDCNMMKRSDRDGKYCVNWDDERYKKIKRDVPVDQKISLYSVASELDAPTPIILSPLKISEKTVTSTAPAVASQGTLKSTDYHLAPQEQ